MIHFTKRKFIPDSFTSGSSSSDLSSQLGSFVDRFGWLIPIIVALSVYYVSLNNFFTFDDFIWLNRARTIKQNWLQIFRVDVTYFDPLIHLMFWSDSVIGGLNYRWYHSIDLAIHCINSLLIYRLARLLSGDEKAAIYASILFASSFAIADAVLWSSSRVDLLSTLCSIGALIQFLKFLRSDNSWRPFVFSFLLFFLALCSKGTPIVLPLILVWLIIQEKKPLKYVLHLTPFCAVIIIYFVLLKLNIHQASLPLNRLHFNIGNLAIAFCSLYIPEETLKYINLAVSTSMLFIMVSALALPTLSLISTVKLRRTGYCALLVAILPVLILTDFTLVTEYSDTYQLLSSASHRIYLASVGAALLGGGLLRSIEMLLKNIFPRFATVAIISILVGVVTGNAYLVRQRDHLWESAGNVFQLAFNGLQVYRQQISEGSQIGLIDFPGSGGFRAPMVKVCLDINDVTILREVTIGKMTNDLDILQKAERSFLFVFANFGHVYDKSPLFRQQLLLNRMAIQNPDRPELTAEYLTIAQKLIQELSNL